MLSTHKMEEMIGLLLTIGVIISSTLVLIGGILFLWQHGSENMKMELLQTGTYSPSFQQLYQSIFTFSSTALIELGLFVLVITQLLRVGLLGLFYLAQRDYVFTLISFFILLMLIYSIILKD